MLSFEVGEDTVLFPEHWGQVTLKQAKDYLALPTHGEFTSKALSIFTGKPSSLFHKHKQTSVQLIAHLANNFASIPAFDKPSIVEYEGKRYLMPESLASYKLDAYQDALNISMMSASKELSEPEIIQIYEKIFKIFLYDMASDKKDEYIGTEENFRFKIKEYDYQEAMSMNIDSMLLSEVVGWGSFFFRKLIKLNIGTDQNSNLLVKKGKVRQWIRAISYFLRSLV